MDITTLGAALAIAKSIPDTAVGDCTAAAARAEAAAESIEEAAETLEQFEDTGLIMVNGKLCVKVERS